MLKITVFHLRLLHSTNVFTILAIFIAFLFAAPSLKLDSEIWFQVMLTLPAITTFSPIMALYSRPEFRTTKPFVHSLPIAKAKVVLFNYLLLFSMFWISILLTLTISKTNLNFVSEHGITINIYQIIKYNLIFMIVPVLTILPFLFKNKMSDKKLFILFIIIICNIAPLFKRLSNVISTIRLPILTIVILVISIISIWLSVRFYHKQEIQC